jgi:RNA polymerase sigma factor (sigma-70 family)
METLSDLVGAARGGDERAFACIVERFQDMAYATAYGLVGDFHLAQDVAQEAFVDAYLHLDQLREPAAFAGWFRRILVKHSDRQTRGKYPVLLPVEMANRLPAETADPMRALENAELRHQVHAAIAALPEDQRMVTTLFHIAGYAQHEYLHCQDATLRRPQATQTEDDHHGTGTIGNNKAIPQQ